jgi:hypothetical protein
VVHQLPLARLASSPAPCPRRVFLPALTCNPPYAHENVGSATQHELLERADPARVVRPCRPKDALSQVGDDPAGLSPIDEVPDGSPRRSVCSAFAKHLTCPLVGNRHNELWMTHQVHVGSLSAQADDPIRRVMASPRLSAGGLRFLDLPVPAVALSLPSEDRRAYWTEVQTTTGLPRFAPVRYDRGGCFLYSGVVVSRHGTGAGSPVTAGTGGCLLW